MASSKDPIIEQLEDASEIYITRFSRINVLIGKLIDAKNPASEEFVDAWVDFVRISIAYQAFWRNLATTLGKLQPSTQAGVEKIEPAVGDVGKAESDQPPSGIDGESRPGEL